jgi:hypothetical protein
MFCRDVDIGSGDARLAWRTGQSFTLVENPCSPQAQPGLFDMAKSRTRSLVGRLLQAEAKTAGIE